MLWMAYLRRKNTSLDAYDLEKHTNQYVHLVIFSLHYCYYSVIFCQLNHSLILADKKNKDFFKISGDLHIFNISRSKNLVMSNEMSIEKKESYNKN